MKIVYGEKPVFEDVLLPEALCLLDIVFQDAKEFFATSAFFSAGALVVKLKTACCIVDELIQKHGSDSTPATQDFKHRFTGYWDKTDVCALVALGRDQSAGVARLVLQRLVFMTCEFAKKHKEIKPLCDCCCGLSAQLP